ncbi:MAG TPA: TetR/AcrR family transcriptional regulator [Baekduia sp.]|nr:TetR/AcrR family transcriptional regulator [Baekduia sp.]
MTTSKTTRLPPDERREQLVRLGLELLGQTPHDQVSIEAIARAAGISKGLLYHYFPTKADFVVAVLRQSHAELTRRMAPDPSVAMTAGERLDATIDAFLGYVQEHATGFLAVTHARAGGDEAVRAVLEEQRAARVDSLADFAAALAQAPREDITSPALTLVLEGWLFFCDGVVAGWLARGELTRPQVLHLLRENLLAALASVAGADDRPAARRLADRAAGLRRLASLA